MSNSTPPGHWKFPRCTYGKVESSGGELRAQLVQDYMFGATFKEAKPVANYIRGLKDWRADHSTHAGDFISILNGMDFRNVAGAQGVAAHLAQGNMALENFVFYTLELGETKIRLEFIKRFFEKDLVELKDMIDWHSRSPRKDDYKTVIQCMINDYKNMAQCHEAGVQMAVEIFTPTEPKDLSAGDYAPRGPSR